MSSPIDDIAFIDLKAQQARIRPAIEKRLNAVLDHGRYIAGPEIQELEEKLAQRTGANGVVACASGTAALIIPLLTFGVECGDAVFIPAFTYNATANAVLIAGATPVFVDIDPDSFNICPKALEARIAEVKAEGKLRPRGVVPVDLFGAPARYPEIEAIAARDDLFILADGAQSFGGGIGNRWVGNLAPVTATSFFPGKALGAYGDAGAVMTQNADDLETWESIRWHGTDSARKDSVRVGFNGRMDSFQAAVLLEKLAIFDDELDARHEIAARYDARLGALARIQDIPETFHSGRAYYSIRVADRDGLSNTLKAAGVPTAVYYRTPLHAMPAFDAFAPEGGLPATEQAADEILALPMHPYLTEGQVDYICDQVEAALEA